MKSKTVRGESCIHRSRAAGAATLIAAGWLLALWGCGGTGGAGEHATGASAAPPPRSSAGQGTPEPISTDRGEVFNVTVQTPTGQFYVDKLEIEFNRRKGIHALYGFYRDSYKELVTIPFRDLKRIEFQGAMSADLFDQAIVGRENMTLDPNAAFDLTLTYRDQHQQEFFAIIPKFRGEKDFQLWEFPMDNHAKAIDYIDFNR